MSIDVSGPWFYALCLDCGAQEPFRSAEDAATWEHECADDAPAETTLTITVQNDLALPPKVHINGRGSWSAVDEIAQVARDLQSAKYGDGDMLAASREGHDRRRRTEAHRLVAEMENALRFPSVCPACGSRFASDRGVNVHLRSCRKVAS